MANQPDPATLRTFLDVAEHAVRRAGHEVARAFRSLPASAVQEKGPGDMVTEVDQRVEGMLAEALLGAFPDHGFVGEEGTQGSLNAEFLWLVDPVDGTSNFAQGLYPHAVAVALLHRGAPVVAAIQAFPDDSTWTATVGGGAFCQGRPVRCPATQLTARSILGVQWFRNSTDLRLVTAMQGTGARIRTHGCSVTQLCDVAMGRLHANIQQQGRPWDLAAAGLVAIEAGVKLTDWRGNPVERYADPVHGHTATVAAPEPLHAELLARLAQMPGGPDPDPPDPGPPDPDPKG